MPIDEAPGAALPPDGGAPDAAGGAAAARFAVDPLLVLIVAVWAINVSFIKIAVREITPLRGSLIRTLAFRSIPSSITQPTQGRSARPANRKRESAA